MNKTTIFSTLFLILLFSFQTQAAESTEAFNQFGVSFKYPSTLEYTAQVSKSGTHKYKMKRKAFSLSLSTFKDQSTKVMAPLINQKIKEKFEEKKQNPRMGTSELNTAQGKLSATTFNTTISGQEIMQEMYYFNVSEPTKGMVMITLTYAKNVSSSTADFKLTKDLLGKTLKYK